MSNPIDSGPLLVGWREWLALPALGVHALKAKVDTGARSSALHVENLEIDQSDGQWRARFWLPPGPHLSPIHIDTPVTDFRQVTDSGGRSSRRPFIRTLAELAGRRWPIEMNLTQRTHMLFPMLLGRTAIAGRFQVDPALSYLHGQPGPTETP